MRLPWWEEYDGLLEEEIQKLQEAGFRCIKVDENLKQRGLLSLSFDRTIDGRDISFKAMFPEHYPYFRPEVFAKGITLTHHQNPREGNLCLLEHSTSAWNPNCSLARLLENLQETIRSGDAESIEEAGNEVPQPEPISEYMDFYPGSIIIFDGSWEIPADIHNGTLHISIIPSISSVLSPRSFVAAITKVKDSKGDCIVKTDERLSENLKPLSSLSGRWIRIPNIKDFTDNLRTMDPSALMKKLERMDASLMKITNNQDNIIIGLLFKEETTHRKEGDGWAIIHGKITRSFSTRGKKGKKVVTGLEISPILIKGSRAGWDDLKVRVPIRDRLQPKKITLIGVGCIGAPIAFELARAGVGELRILDPDRIDAGNAVRWPLGFSSAGTHKAIAISEFIRQNIPYTKVAWKIGKVGGITFPSEETQGIETHGEMLESVLLDTDLIIDATGEDGVNHFLSELAGHRKIPIIFAATTVGTWGGDIVRIIPGETQGCWACYGYSQIEGKIPKPLRDPSRDAAEVAPRGCSAPTYIGNQFDATIISMACVRTAIRTLLGSSGEYPLNDADVTTIQLRDSNGIPIMPVFESHQLHHHNQCTSDLHQ